MQTYEIRMLSGEFVTEETKSHALMAARLLVDAPDRTTEVELSAHWGVTITKLSKSEARSRGFE